jgi:hypothetical protein
MTIDRISGNYEQPLSAGRPAQKREAVESEQSISDQVTISGKADSFPKLIVGAPTSRLDPMIDEPIVHPVPFGIEIKNGVAIGIDGQSIIVGQGVEGKIDITGHLEDGTYPQRDYRITRESGKTTVDGLYDWQDATITGRGNNVHIKGETARESFDARETSSGVEIRGQWPVQNFNIENRGKEIDIKGYEPVDSYNLVTEGNVTTITNKSGFDDMNYTITKKDAHSMHVEGKMAYQKFDITWNDSEMVVKGFYPHQKHVIKFNA